MKGDTLPKIKTAVLVVDLIKAIEKVRDAEVKVIQAREALYPAKRKAWERALKKHILEKARLVKPGFRIPKNGWRHNLDEWLGGGAPEEPVGGEERARAAEKCARDKYDKLISQLRMSQEPKVRLSPDDYRRFMQGDAAACAC